MGFNISNRPERPQGFAQTQPRLTLGQTRGGATERLARSGQAALGVGRTSAPVRTEIARSAFRPSEKQSEPVAVLPQAIRGEKSNGDGERVVNETISGQAKPDQPVLDRLQAAVENNDGEALFKLLDQQGEKQPDLIGDLLVQLALKGDEDGYSFVIDTLKERYVDIDTYIRFGEEGRVITPEGLKVLLDQLKETRPWIIDTLVTDSGKEVKNELQRLAKEQGDFQKVIVFDDGDHFRPILIEKKGDDLHVLVTDSLGDEMGRVTGMSANEVIKFMPGATVYTLDEKRQTDKNTCSVFALRDLVQLSRYQQQGDIFAYAADRVTSKNSEQDQIFSQLPPEMMKTTQSVTKLNAKYPEAKQALKKKGKEYLVPDSRSQAGERNVYVKKKHQKYEQLLIAAAVREGMKQKAGG
ncbi:MAG: hypothetical protein KDK65_05855 [Chlamydiia bacterium]|nr:hypothetical protein [Chlamydiia bacterium]